MTQDELRFRKYNAVVASINTNQRLPSKYIIEDHLLLNWIKQNRKLLNAGRMKESRVEMFEKLLAKCEGYKRKNQYQ